ncbi:MAG: deoxyguanosinetriphosphate triphosphohydrolase [Desulfuromonadales bacterium]|nr:deoxyguanosinetriphosphate triphosphohydrolase [Desulfuromonadales bacterium]
MNFRISTENNEELFLGPGACLSRSTRGRERSEEACPVRTAFQVDRDRILHCKAFRRLKHKTQVFLAPEGDHYRTRLTHTLEVSQIARTIARALRLNEDLTEAIALGHDLGHTPFGHAGERVLDELLPGGFHHVSQSLRVVDKLERGGAGLNLTWEVRDGILGHSKGQGSLAGARRDDLPATQEGKLVRLADVIAYVNHDLDDATRSGLISLTDVPERLRALLGETHSQRIDTMVNDILASSMDGALVEVRLSDRIRDGVAGLRDWLFQNVYRADPVESDFLKASRVLRELFQHFMNHPSDLTSCAEGEASSDPPEVLVADFLAGMTDRYAMNLYQRLFLPQPWKTL